MQKSISVQRKIYSVLKRGSMNPPPKSGADEFFFLKLSSQFERATQMSNRAKVWHLQNEFFICYRGQTFLWYAMGTKKISSFTSFCLFNRLRQKKRLIQLVSYTNRCSEVSSSKLCIWLFFSTLFDMQNCRKITKKYTFLLSFFA